MYETNHLKLFEFLRRWYPSSCIQYIGSGWSSIVFLVDNYIIRFPKHNMADYEHELVICHRLNSFVSFEIPIVEMVLDYEYPFVKHKCLVGTIWDTSNMEKRPNQLAKDCACFFSQIHSLSPITSIRKIPTEAPLDIEIVEKKLYIFFDSHMLNKLCYEYETGNIPSIVENVFIHADFHPNNVVLDHNGRLKGVFDWCNSGIGEREKDFVHLFNDMDKQFINTLFVEYYNYCNVEIDKLRVRELALIDLINKLFWADERSEFAQMLQTKIKRMIL